MIASKLEVHAPGTTDTYMYQNAFAAKHCKILGVSKYPL